MSKIRVLVVDDSAFARKVIREVLSRDPEIEVCGIARDGLEALEKVGELNPDVITLDLVMPDLDGLGFLEALPPSVTARVIVVSVSGAETDLAIQALERGAIDIVTKTTPLPTDRLYELSVELVMKVKAAAEARPRLKEQALATNDRPCEPIMLNRCTTRLAVIGTSTGGPQALTRLFAALQPGLPFPIAIALHIPAGFTGPLAARLSANGQVKVHEAYDGLELLAGEAVLAAGGMHLKIKENAGRLFCAVSFHPAETLHHPSVDLLFQSAARATGRDTVGLILTGMGSDGTQGAKAIHEVGGRILAESASSCVVFGMPRSAIEAGVVLAQAPLEKMLALFIETVSTPVAERA